MSNSSLSYVSQSTAEHPAHSDRSSSNGSDSSGSASWSWRSLLQFVLATLVMALLVTAFAATIISAVDIFLLLFLGVVFGVFLRKCGVWVSNKTPVGPKAGIGIVVALLAVCTIGGLTLAGDMIVERANQMQDELDSVVSKAADKLAEYPLLDSAVRDVPGLGRVLPASTTDASNGSNREDGSAAQPGDRQTDAQSDRDSSGTDGVSQSGSTAVGRFLTNGDANQAAQMGSSAMSGLFRFLGTTFGVVTSVIVIFFVGLFLASDPALYRDGLAKLLPKDRQQTFIDLCNQLGHTLWHWLMGRFASMLVTGLGVWAAMAAIGVPLALLLGVFTALMVFIPNIGAAISVGFAILLALPQGLTTVAMVVVAYSGVQMLESYIITPLIQKRAVELPPALLISSQLVLGVLFGFLGVLTATPLMAVGLVLVRRAYVDDVFALFGARRRPA